MTDLKQWSHASSPKIGTVLTVDHPLTTEVASISGFDWLWLDAEHGQFTAVSAAAACAVNSGGPPIFVRVPDRSPSTLMRFLDAGPDGLIIPQVSSVADAREIAKSALYPPDGERSIGIARAHKYGRYFAEYLATRSYSLIAQIETKLGVQNVEAIVHEPYIDALLIGPYDLSGSCGVPGDVSCNQVQDGIKKVLESCQQADKPCGIFAATAVAAQAYAKQGFSFIGVGIDTSILVNAYKMLLEGSR